MTIYEIKRRTEQSSPHYFTAKSLKFFGQTMKSFSVKKQSDGKYLISAPMRDRRTGRIVGKSERLFNPKTRNI